MSTKIYNAYISKNQTSIDTSFEVIRKLEKEIIPYIEEDFNKKYIRSLVYKRDEAISFNYEKQNLSDIRMQLFHDYLEAKRKVEESGIREPYWDYTIDCVIIPYDGFNIIQFFKDNILRDFDLESWLNRHNYIDFHYQNQTDEPDDVSDEDWGYREIVWNNLLDISHIPAKLGLTYKIISFNDYDSIMLLKNDHLKNFSHFIPSEYKRRKNIATKILFGEYIDGKDDEYMSQLMEAMHHAEKNADSIIDSDKVQLCLNPLEV